MLDNPTIEVSPELFTPFESATFSGSYSLSKLPLGADTYAFEEPLTWSVVLSNTGGALLLAGTVRGVAWTSCGRCLDKVSIPLDGQIEEYFLLDAEGDLPKDYDRDELAILPESHCIDLAPYIQAGILIELPIVPLCDPECKGLCPLCGANLNKEACVCAEGAGDTEPMHANPFSVLADYPFDICDDYVNGQ